MITLMLNFLKDNWFQIFTLVIAVVSIIFTGLEIRKNNRRFLFSARIEYLQLFKRFKISYDLSMCTFGKEAIKKSDLKKLFTQLTSNCYISDYVNEEFFDLKSYNKLANQLEILNNISSKGKYLFKTKNNEIASKFVNSYLLMVNEMNMVYCFNSLEEATDDFINLINTTFNKLRKLNEQIEKENIIEKLEKEIKI